jgi:predicted dehydrogenase
MDLTRRVFLHGTLATAVCPVEVPAMARTAASANDRIRIGIVGAGDRSRFHLEALHRLTAENVEIAAICDCDEAVLHARGAACEQLTGRKVRTETDQRRLFDDSSIDAISFATPDHWHAVQTIWACQAGKDVYLEKPGTHNLFEGRQLVEAARKYKRIVQHGTQLRSSPKIREGIQKIKEGVIGDVYMGRAISFKFRGPLGKHQPGPVPTGLNWDAWLGPAPAQPYSQFRHQRWRWLWDFSSGDMANQLVHQMDLIRWAAGLDEHPLRVQSMGAHFVHDDDQECPNNQTFACQFARNNFLLEAEHRNWCTPSEAGFRDQYPFIQPKFPVGAIVFGTKGYMLFPDHSSYHTFLGQDREAGPTNSVPDHPITDEPHFQNWIAAMRSRDPALLNSEIHEARMTMALPLLGNVAYRLGRTLHFDPKTETCLGDDEANRLLAPRYRKPYVVPATV